MDRSSDELEGIASFLKEKGVMALPCHCTGKDGKFTIKKVLGNNCEEGSVGLNLKINEEGVYVQRYHG